MRTITALVLALLLLPDAAFGQDGAFAEVTTSRTHYAYGETIEIRFTITNAGLEPFQLPGSSSCQAQFYFNDFSSKANTICTLDEVQLWFDPGSSYTWVWRMPPEVYGFPSATGNQTIVGYYPGFPELSDTTVVTGVQYRGGQATFHFFADTSEEDVAPIRDSLNVDVLFRYDWPWGEWTELWQIEGTPLDTVVARYSGDPRVKYVQLNRRIQYASLHVVSTDLEPDDRPEPEVAFYPNPASHTATFALQVHQPEHVRIDIFDVQGRRVATAHDGIVSAGVTHHVTLDARPLAAGMYVYRVSGETLQHWGTFIVAR